MFLVAVGFWNFLGAGIFGFLVNLPVVSYYEIGTALTANHAHAAMFGVYGMLAVALAMFAFRYVIPAEKWPNKLARISFWGMNIGLAWMVFVTLLPLGVLQLFHSVNAGYFEARSLGYITQPGNAVLEWMRLPGDAILIVGGVVPFCWIAWIALRHFRSGQTVDELPEHALYTSVATDATEAATQG
jgi:nitric oxide reductase subunit B